MLASHNAKHNVNYIVQRSTVALFCILHTYVTNTSNIILYIAILMIAMRAEWIRTENQYKKPSCFCCFTCAHIDSIVFYVCECVCMWPPQYALSRCYSRFFPPHVLCWSTRFRNLWVRRLMCAQPSCISAVCLFGCACACTLAIMELSSQPECATELRNKFGCVCMCLFGCVQAIGLTSQPVLDIHRIDREHLGP